MKYLTPAVIILIFISIISIKYSQAQQPNSLSTLISKILKVDEASENDIELIVNKISLKSLRNLTKQELINLNLILSQFLKNNPKVVPPIDKSSKTTKTIDIYMLKPNEYKLLLKGNDQILLLKKRPLKKFSESILKNKTKLEIKKLK